ncbi:hypothetical protein ACOI9P_09160 [Corynebacterium striatum]|uniref:hypothetical protein n=1 Tax=Corynebacterium striatum TaxID=43770 RepID=UPI003B5B32E2
MNSQKMRHFRWLALVLIILAIGAIGLGGLDQPESSTASLPKDMDSTTVAQLQEEISKQESEGESAQAAIVFLIRISHSMSMPCVVWQRSSAARSSRARMGSLPSSRFR